MINKNIIKYNQPFHNLNKLINTNIAESNKYKN